MPYIFANDFGGIGAGNLSAESERNRAMQASLTRLIAGIEEGRRQKEFGQRMQFESEGRRADQDYRNRALNLQDQERRWQHERDLSKDELGKGWLNLSRDQLDWQKGQPTPQQQRESDVEYNRALMRAQTGDFESPDEVKQMHPTLSSQQAAGIADISKNARPAIESAWDVASNAAETLNQHETAKRYLPIVTKAVNEGNSMWTSKAGESDEMKYYRSQVADWTDRLNQLGPKAARIQADKRIAGLVTYDPEQDQFVPAIPAPHWLNKQSPSAAPTPRGGAAAQAPTSSVSIGGARPLPIAGGGRNEWDQDYAEQGMDQGPPPRMAQAGPVSLPRTTSTGTTAYTPQHPPMVYDRFNYWIGQGLDPVSAKRRAITEVSAVQGP